MKAAYRSKTILVNVLVVMLALLQDANVLTIVPPRLMGYIVTLVAVLNIVLRFLTTQPVSLMGEVR